MSTFNQGVTPTPSASKNLKQKRERDQNFYLSGTQMNMVKLCLGIKIRITKTTQRWL